MKIGLDLDGTILDIQFRQSYLLKTIAGFFGIKLDPEEIWTLKRTGLSNQKILELNNVNDFKVKTICNMWSRDIETLPWLSIDRLLPGVVDALESAKESGNSLYLITARSNEHNLHCQIRNLRIEKYFSRIHVVSQHDKIQKKASFLKSENIFVFIGDTEADYASAIQSKVKFVAVISGQRSHQSLRNFGVEAIVPNLSVAIQQICTEPKTSGIKVDHDYRH